MAVSPPSPMMDMYTAQDTPPCTSEGLFNPRVEISFLRKKWKTRKKYNSKNRDGLNLVWADPELSMHIPLLGISHDPSLNRAQTSLAPPTTSQEPGPSTPTVLVQHTLNQFTLESPAIGWLHHHTAATNLKLSQRGNLLIQGRRSSGGRTERSLPPSHQVSCQPRSTWWQIHH